MIKTQIKSLYQKQIKKKFKPQQNTESKLSLKP